MYTRCITAEALKFKTQITVFIAFNLLLINGLTSQGRNGVKSDSDVPSQEYFSNLAEKAESFLNSNADSVLLYSHELLKLSLRHNELLYGGLSYSLMGRGYQKKKDYLISLEMFSKAKNKFIQIEDEMLIHTTSCQMAGVLLDLGEYDRSVSKLDECISFFESTNQIKGLGKSLIMKATALLKLNDLTRARQSITQVERLEDEELFDLDYIIVKARIEEASGNYEDAKISYEDILNKSEEDQDFETSIESAFSLARISKLQNDLNQYNLYLELIKRIAEKHDLNEYLLEYYKQVSDDALLKGDFEQAYYALGKYNELNEGVVKKKTNARDKELESWLVAEETKQYLDQKAEDLALQEDKSKNKFLPLAIAFFVLLVALIVLMLRSSSRKRINKILLKKNSEIDGHRRRVMASIQYAKTIQDSLLNNQEVLNKVFPFSSVYFRAKDVVSGDMFWVGEKKHKKIIAAVDCTGHGVPGAFMSLIANESINNAINNSKNLDPGKLIIDIHKNLMEALESSEGKNSKEGMDMSICVIDEIKREIEYAGAKNSIFIKRKNEITELKAAPISIGGMYSEVMERHAMPFPTHKMSYNHGSEIFLFTDGILDQFGGEEGKKLNKSGFKKLLAAYSGRIEVMDHYVTDFMDKWMGENEQLDDMLLLGVRL